MSPTIKEIACTSCGAPLHLANPASRTARCAQCGAQLDLTTPEFAVLGTFHRRKLPRGIRVGLPFDWEGETYLVRGVIGYSDGKYKWYEFFLLSESGQVLWLELDDGNWFLFKPFRPQQPVDPEQVTSKLTLDGEHHVLMDRGSMRVTYLEGELSWKLKKDDQVKWLDASKVGVEWTDDDVEFFHRAPLSDRDVLAAFRDSIRRSSTASASSSGLASGGGSNNGSGCLILVAIFIILFIIIVMVNSNSTGFSSSGWSSGGHSSRSFGGGFSGGK